MPNFLNAKQLAITDFFSAIKSVALGMDACLKANGQKDVKFHQVYSSVILAIRPLLESHPHEVYELFHLNEDPEITGKMLGFLRQQEGLINAAGLDDVRLNAAVSGGPVFPLIDQLVPVTFIDESVSQFRGELKISASFDAKKAIADIKPGEAVNIRLSLNPDDARRITENSHVEQLGFKQGRLTSTEDTTERHVSIALRTPFRPEVLNFIEAKNRQLRERAFETAGKQKIVVPPDIRTQVSILTLISQSSIQAIEELRKEVAGLAPGGNKLPPLHITQGNMPVEPASPETLLRLRNLTEIHENYLHQFHLDLDAAIPHFSALHP
ncbi:MAG: hypothetical protein A2X78_01365 [Gammaproteobacteria bacterium GWE2_37_16]|nr:MAG: hypothetical protein A2X78_01365 [Gammaproteobacteria bacterium GWE2_37_16]